MLTSSARETLVNVETVIIDEIHALAPTKRGAHLMLSLERLEEITSRPPQRIGLSATQRPLEEVAHFLGGWSARRARRARSPSSTPASASRSRSTSSSRWRTWATSARRRTGGCAAVRPASAMAPVRKSIWPSIYPRILEQVLAHRSTIIFCNARRQAERLAAHLNELAETEGVDVGRGRRAGQGPPRLAGPRAARRHRGPAEARRAARPRRHQSSLELGIDMGAVDLVIQVESPGAVSRGPAAHRPRRPLGGRAEPGHDLPQAPRRPARGGGRHPAHARRPDRDHPLPAQPARRARPADRRPRRRSTPSARSTTVAALVRRCAELRRADRRSAAQRARPAGRPLPERGVQRAAARGSCGIASAARCAPATAPSDWPSRAAAPSPTAACSACSCPTARVSASSTRRWSTRAAPARRSCSARPRGGSRTSRFERVDGHAGAGRAGQDAVLARRPARPPARARPGARRVPPRDPRAAAGRRPRTACATTTASTRFAADNVRALPRRAGRGDRRRARRPHGRGRALPRRDRRLAGVHAQPVRHAGARAVGDGHRAPADGALRHAGRDDVERRRHRAAPARGRRRAAARRADDRPRRHRRAGGRDAAADVAVLGPLPRVRGAGAAAAPPPARLAHAAVAAAPARRRPAGGGGEVPDASRSCSRPAGSACRTCSTCPPCARCSGSCAAARCAWSASTRPRRRRSRRACCSTGSPPTCTRATRRWPSDGPRRWRSTATCCATCSGRRSCASCSTRACWPTSSSSCSA